VVAITSQFSSVSVEIVIASLAIFNWLHIAENKIKICRQVPQGGGAIGAFYHGKKYTVFFWLTENACGISVRSVFCLARWSPSNSIWPYLSSDLVRSEREYC